MKCNIDINEKVFNKVYIPYLLLQIYIQIFFGGSASGKSVFLAQRCISDILKGDRNYLIVRNVGRTHKTSTHNEISKVIFQWGVNHLFNISKSELTITCINGYQILFVGLDDVEKIKSITPAKGILTDIWIEEATEVKKDDYKQLTKRLRGISKVPKRITLSFNPIMRTHWIYKEFFQGFNDDDTQYQDNDLSILKTTYKDNRFLAAEDSHYLESEKNQYYYDVYTLGKWGILGHLIFTNWKTANLTGRRDAFGSYLNGLDYGYTNDPTAFARCAIKDRILYITHSLYEYGLTNEQIADKIKITLGKDILRCDPSEPKSTNELRGYNINAISAKGGKGSVNHGIQYIQHFDEVIIHQELQDCINEFQTYQWEKNRDGEVMNVPIDRDNHYIDALRYALSGVSFMPDREESNFDYSLTGLSG